MSTNRIPRRKFIRHAAVAAVSFPFVNFLASSLRAADGPPRKLGFALAGLGGLSNGQLAPALQLTQNCRLAGIVTGTPSKIPIWKAKYNIPDKNVYSYDTMDKLADNPDIDVVYVVTPNGLHAEHSIKALKAGKHVFCEKPMEISAERCEQMIAEAKKAGKMLSIGYRCQYDPSHIECRRLAQEKVFGELKTIEAGFSRGITATEWRVQKALAGGGPLMDVGIYALQTCRFVSGREPVEVSAKFMPITDPVKFKEVEEGVDWEMTFPGGLTTKCHTDYERSSVHGFMVTAEKGTFRTRPRLQLQQFARHAQRRPGDRPVEHQPVCRRDGRLRPVHPEQQAEQSPRRRRPARREDHDGHLRIRPHWQAGQTRLISDSGFGIIITRLFFHCVLSP